MPGASHRNSESSPDSSRTSLPICAFWPPKRIQRSPSFSTRTSTPTRQSSSRSEPSRSASNRDSPCRTSWARRSMIFAFGRVAELAPGTGLEPVRTFVQRGLSLTYTVRTLRFRPDVHVPYELGVRPVHPVRLNPAGAGEPCEHLVITRRARRRTRRRVATAGEEGANSLPWRRTRRSFRRVLSDDRRVLDRGAALKAPEAGGFADSQSDPAWRYSRSDGRATGSGHG